MDRYIKTFVKMLYELYGYRIMEITGAFGLVSPWCAVKITGNNARIILFAPLEGIIDNTGVIAREIMEQTGCIEADTTVVYIMDKNREAFIDRFSRMSSPGIIIDKESDSVVYASKVDEITLNQIYQCLLNMGKTNGSEKVKAPVTFTIIGINVAAYILTAVLSGNIASSNINVLVLLGAKVNSLIDQGQLYRLITCMFLHGGIVHLGFNMYALYSIGPLLENVFGKRKFTIIYFVSGILSSLMSYTFSSDISIGASGAIFGLLGACLVFGYKMKQSIGRDFLMNIIMVIVVNLIMGFSIPNIDNFGHLGGLIGGTACTILLTLKK